MFGWIAAAILALILPLASGFAAAPASEPQSAAPPPPCRTGADDSGATAGYQESDGAMAGFLLIYTGRATGCTLQGRPEIRILGRGGGVLVASDPAASADAPVITVLPGQPALAAFTWSNWCPAQPASPFLFSVALPDAPNRFHIAPRIGGPQIAREPYPPLEREAHAPLQTAVPRCRDPQRPTRLIVEPFRPQEGATTLPGLPNTGGGDATPLLPPQAGLTVVAALALATTVLVRHKRRGAQRTRAMEQHP